MNTVEKNILSFGDNKNIILLLFLILMQNYSSNFSYHKNHIKCVLNAIKNLNNKISVQFIRAS